MSTSADYYFDSYAHFGIHEEMLKDSVRTNSYMNAIKQNKHVFKDKIVLDVGCGTGILSMFCAQAGAKHVYGVDMSNIILKAREIVKINHLDDKVTLLQGKMEEIELPVEKVDIIVSEWMGYFLLYESMLDTVLYARDRYLVPGGKIFPDVAIMYVAGIEDGDYYDEKINYWDNVYGFDYSPIKEVAVREPLVDMVEFKAVMTDPCELFRIDITTVTKEQLSFSADFAIRARRQDYCHALISWFDIEFNACHKPVKFSTGPQAQYTHWKQTVFYIGQALTMNAGELVKGHLRCAPNDKNPRDLDIHVDYAFEPQQQKHRTVRVSKDYRMC
ncbi:Nuclear SAM-dependent mono-and asymmetric methyltransferase [Savitreella phatthalungensis]